MIICCAKQNEDRLVIMRMKWQAFSIQENGRRQGEINESLREPLYLPVKTWTKLPRREKTEAQAARMYD
jgi:hypothetical protein